MRRLGRARLARRPARHRKPLQVERDHQRLRLHAIEEEVAGVDHARDRLSVRATAVDACLLDRRQDSLLQAVAQRGEARGAVRSGCDEPGPREFRRAPQPDDAGDVLRAGTPAALVHPAEEHRLQPHVAAHKQRARALRRVHLVAGEGKQVAAHLLHVERKLARGLDRIGMEQRAGRVRRVRQLAHRLQDAGLIVGQHDADKLGVGPQRRFQCAHFHHALRRARQKGDLDSALSQLLGGMQHGVVLHAADDQVVVRREQAEQRHIVALRAARGEDHFRRAAAQQPGHRLARVVHRGARVLAALMDGAGVAKLLLPERLHRPLHLRQHGRGRVGVHVNSPHISSLSA